MVYIQSPRRKRLWEVCRLECLQVVLEVLPGLGAEKS